MYRYDVPRHVPLEGDNPTTNLPLDAVSKMRSCFVLRVAMMNRIFIETGNGQVQHSAASRILMKSQDPWMHVVSGMMKCL